MAENQTLLNDILSLGGTLFQSLIGQRHVIKSEVKECLARGLSKMEIVSRHEFDAAFAMLAKSREAQEAIQERLSKIETKLNLSRTSSPPKGKKRNLPSVKNSNRKTNRK